jgi:hypothetical protein
MKQDCETNDVVEHGRVTADTHGGQWIKEDSESGMSLSGGLTDD